MYLYHCLLFLQDAGGMMTLTDAFCRLNRARGLELVSPDDLINACNSPLALHTFEGTGVMVLRYGAVHAECFTRGTGDFDIIP